MRAAGDTCAGAYTLESCSAWPPASSPSTGRRSWCAEAMKEPSGGKGAGAGGKAVSLPAALHMTVPIDGRSGEGCWKARARAPLPPSLPLLEKMQAGRGAVLWRLVPPRAASTF